MPDAKQGSAQASLAFRGRRRKRESRSAPGLLRLLLVRLSPKYSGCRPLTSKREHRGSGRPVVRNHRFVSHVAAASVRARQKVAANPDRSGYSVRWRHGLELAGRQGFHGGELWGLSRRVPGSGEVVSHAGRCQTQATLTPYLVGPNGRRTTARPLSSGRGSLDARSLCQAGWSGPATTAWQSRHIQ